MSWSDMAAEWAPWLGGGPAYARCASFGWQAGLPRHSSAGAKAGYLTSSMASAGRKVERCMVPANRIGPIARAPGSRRNAVRQTPLSHGVPRKLSSSHGLRLETAMPPASPATTRMPMLCCSRLATSWSSASASSISSPSVLSTPCAFSSSRCCRQARACSSSDSAPAGTGGRPRRQPEAFPQGGGAAGAEQQPRLANEAELGVERGQRAVLGRRGGGRWRGFGSRQRVKALAPQLRQHFVRQPALETLGLRLARGENQAVDPRLGDADHGLFTPHGVGNSDPIVALVVVETAESITFILDFEHATDIAADEPGFAVRFYDADQVVFEGKRNKRGHGRPSDWQVLPLPKGLFDPLVAGANNLVRDQAGFFVRLRALYRRTPAMGAEEG